MASNSAPKTILLRGRPASEEGAANAASIYPGMLVERMTTGKLRPHSSAAGVASALFARENETLGKSIDTIYASGDNVLMWNCVKGDWVYAYLKNGENVAVGAFLESDGAGALKATTHGTGSATAAAAWPIARALEAVDNSGGGTGPNSTKRIKVEVL